MRLVRINAKEKTVTIDATALKVDFTIDDSYYMIHWDQSVGEGFIEKNEGKGRVIKDFSEFAYIVEAFNKKLNDKSNSTDYTLSIVPEDGMVSVDGICLYMPELDIDPNYHAVHWDGDSGYIETKQGINLSLTSIDEFANIVAEHADISADIKSKADLAEAEANLPINVWMREMAATDMDMPRALEDVIDAMDEDSRANLADETYYKYTNKKSLRATNPDGSK